MKLSQHMISILDSLDRVVIAVSGGSDSMVVFFVIYQCWLSQSKDPNNIIVAHYNHQVRPESYQDIELIRQYCHDVTIEYGEYVGESDSERDLRVARHQFFVDVMNKYSTPYIITGHNLTDRIETSLLNMKRGSQMRGFLNMREHDQQYLRTGNVQQVYHYLRPLLIYPKATITDFCIQQQIPYHHDYTNDDVTVSQRNHIRQGIVMKLTQQDLADRQGLYHRLEESQTTYNDPVRDDTVQARCVGSVGNWSLEYLARLFDWSGCYADMTQGRLLEWQKWIVTSYQGEKMVGGRKRWIKNKCVYMSQDLL